MCNMFGEPIFMHPPETPKAFEYKDSFQFIGWFVPVESEPRLALKTMTCKKEVTSYVLVAADGVKTEKPVQSSRPKFPCCEVPTVSAKRMAQMACQKDRMTKR